MSEGSSGVVSLGGINVDLVVTVGREELDDLESRHAPFPGPGETVEVEAVPEILGGFDFRTSTGGKGANQAFAAARAGAETAFLGVVGEDHGEFGVLDSLHDAGVDTDGVGVRRTPTGRAYIFVEETGENRIVWIEGANADVDVAYVRERYGTVADAAVLVLQNELPTGPVDWLLGRLDGDPDRPTVILDPAPPEGVGPLLAHRSVDFVTPNGPEYRALSASLDAFRGTVIRTRGPEDVIVEDGASFSVAPPAVEAVDTTGAGDAFTGYLAAGLAAGDDLRDAVEDAAVAGALSVRHEGARTAPPRDAVESVRS